MTDYLSFDSNAPAGKALMAWHRTLYPLPPKAGERRQGPNFSGDRALLKKAGRLLDVAFVPSYHRLLSSLEQEAPGARRHGAAKHRERLALVAALAARAKKHQPGTSFAAQMGKPKEGAKTARVSEARFRRLLTAEDPDDLLQHLGRLVHLLGGEVDLASLAQGAYWWNDDTRRQWAYDYYRAAPAARS